MAGKQRAGQGVLPFEYEAVSLNLQESAHKATIDHDATIMNEVERAQGAYFATNMSAPPLRVRVVAPGSPAPPR